MLKKLSFLFLTFSLLTTSAFAQSGINVVGSGARAAAMGYAFTGLADDATAISWNPAGLAQLQEMEASIYGRFGTQSISYDNLPQDYMLYDSYNNSYYDYSIESYDIESESQFQLNFASFVFPFKLQDFNLVAGLAYRRYMDFSNEYTHKYTRTDDYNPYGSYISIFNKDYEKVYTYEGSVNAISPSVAFAINDQFSIGVTVNILTGNETYSDNVKYHFIDTGVSNPEATEKNEEYKVSSYDVDYSGFNIDFGILAKLSPQFSIGAKITTPYDLEYEYNKSLVYESGIEYDLTPSGTYAYEIPLTFGVGAVFRATDNFTISADYQHRPFDGAKKTYDGDEVGEFQYDYNSFHVGMEYLVIAGDLVVPIRAGFYTSPQGKEDANEDQVIENVVTLGSGLLIGNLNINAAFEMGFRSYEQYWFTDTDDVVVDYTLNSYRLTVGATLHL